jgi:hypothetical protein
MNENSDCSIVEVVYHITCLSQIGQFASIWNDERESRFLAVGLVIGPTDLSYWHGIDRLSQFSARKPSIL